MEPQMSNVIHICGFCKRAKAVSKSSDMMVCNPCFDILEMDYGWIDASMDALLSKWDDDIWNDKMIDDVDLDSFLDSIKIICPVVTSEVECVPTSCSLDVEFDLEFVIKDS
jgi:hypothetical protein